MPRKLQVTQMTCHQTRSQALNQVTRQREPVGLRWPGLGPRAQGTERKSPFARRLPWWGPPSWFLPKACLACTQSCVPQHLPVPRLPPGRWRPVPPAETQDPHGPDRLRQLQPPEQQAIELPGTLTQRCSPLSSLCGAAGRPEVTGRLQARGQ